jgi:hypothetical protein
MDIPVDSRDLDNSFSFQPCHHAASLTTLIRMISIYIAKIEQIKIHVEGS